MVLNELSCHLRWVADRLGGARGWAQLPSLAVASASGRCLSVNYELTSAGIREAIELATPQRQRQAQQHTTPPRCPTPLLASATALAFAHGTAALPLLSQSAPKPPLKAGARLPRRRRHPRLVARPAPSAPARWPRAASAETAAQLLGGRSEWVQAPRHRHPTARCPNGPPTANRPLALPALARE